MTPITQAKLAQLAGVTPQQITKVVRFKPPQLTIVKLPGKAKLFIDLDGHLTAQYLHGRTPKELKEPTETKKEPGKEEKPINPYQDDGNYKSKSHNPSGVRIPGSESKHDLDRIYIEEKIENTRIKNEQLRATLIPKDLVEKIFSKIHSIDDTQFKTIGINTNSKIESVYGQDNIRKVGQILELFSRLPDDRIKSDIQKILEEGETGRTLEINSIMEDATGSILKNIQREIDDFLILCGELAEK